MKRLIVGLIYLGLVLARFSNQFQAEGKLRQWEGKEISVIGKISSEPILQAGSQRFKVGRVEVRTKAYPRYSYGEKVQVFGSLQRQVVNKWYSRFRLMYPEIKRVEADKSKIMGLEIKKGILELRKRIEGVFNRGLAEPEASLAAGIVLGSKRGLSEDFWEKLQRTGTLHIVVASGYNVTVVLGVVVGYLAGWVKRRTAVVLGILAVVGYVMMAGGEAAIVRAGIMGSLAYFGQVLGRKADGLRLLMAAVMGMILFNPMIIWDVGFQLSVMATLGLMVVGPWLEGLTRIGFIGGDLRDTLAAQIGVWPILVISFGNLSVFAIVVNSLILWLVPVIMGLGGVMAVVGLVWPWLGQVMGWLVYLPLTVMVRVIEGFGVQEWMSFEVEGLSWWWGLGYYLALGLWLVRRKMRYKFNFKR